MSLTDPLAQLLVHIRYQMGRHASIDAFSEVVYPCLLHTLLLPVYDGSRARLNVVFIAIGSRIDGNSLLNVLEKSSIYVVLP